MVASIIYETGFWLAINIILAIVIIGLVYKQYASARSHSTTPDNVAGSTPDLGDIIERFRTMVSQGRGGEAIVSSYRDLLNRLIMDRAPAYLTFNEILESGFKLSSEILAHLRNMYKVYEPTRFGDYNPSQQELDMFLKSIEAVNAHIRVWRSVVPTV
jgi:hypothetical protein